MSTATLRAPQSPQPITVPINESTTVAEAFAAAGTPLNWTHVVRSEGRPVDPAEQIRRDRQYTATLREAGG